MWRSVAIGVVLAVVLAGCGSGVAAKQQTGITLMSPGVSSGGSGKVPCDQIDLVRPNWQQPEPAATRVASVVAARRVSRLPVVAPVGLGDPAVIYARAGLATFLFHGSSTGDVVVSESRPQFSAEDWRQELRAVPAQNGKPGVTGTAKVLDVGPNAKALQTVNPCISGSTTDWHTGDGRMEIVIIGRTLSATSAERSARLTEATVGAP
jgi:hypothetical protein